MKSPSKPMEWVIVDYGMGNLLNVRRAFEILGAKVCVSSRADVIRKAEGLVLPGVGAFTKASEELHRLGLVDPIREKVLAQTPYIGLCLGLQLLFEKSEEGPGKGLGILPGEVRRFTPSAELKVPHMGWNSVEARSPQDALWAGIPERAYFYFVHSFYVLPRDKSVIAGTTEYGISFASVIKQGHIFATQFHPEKSQALGLKLLGNALSAAGALL